MTLSYRIREFLARRFTAISQPDVSRDYRRERASGAFVEKDEMPSHLLVEDNGSDTTVFSFASNALLFAGQPTFELQGYLNTLGPSVNRVYLRDIHRTAYHLTPKGIPGGLAFYEGEVNRLMTELGAGTHIAIGDSSGGAAALYYGTRCGMDKAIAFSPPFPVHNWASARAQLRALLDWRLLRESRHAYWEVLTLGVMSSLFAKDLRSRVGEDSIWDPVGTYSGAESRPDATVIYGARCVPDARVAALLAHLPEVRLMPIDTGRHNCSTELGRRGLLRDLIAKEVNEAIAKRAATAAIARAESQGIAP